MSSLPPTSRPVPSSPRGRRLRLLVVDDSAYNRALIASLFESGQEVEVVGRAGDGEEALRLAVALQPDVVTLDLEMPKMDGFTFLRLLLARQAVPVIVVSSYAQRENVFRALELGAYEFVTKSHSQIDADERELQRSIREKVLSVQQLGPSFLDSLQKRAAAPRESQSHPAGARKSPPRRLPERVVAIGGSTGAPAAILQIAASLPEDAIASVLVAQHMPDKFTRVFAERLDQRSGWAFAEAQSGSMPWAQRGFVCPGGRCLELERRGETLGLKVDAPTPRDRFVPSVDRLFGSVAEAMGERAVAVVLTGMGDDGLQGAQRVREAGGLVLVEARETAVVYGMPRAVVEAGLAHEILPLPQLGARVAELARGGAC